MKLACLKLPGVYDQRIRNDALVPLGFVQPDGFAFRQLIEGIPLCGRNCLAAQAAGGGVAALMNVNTISAALLGFHLAIAQDGNVAQPLADGRVLRGGAIVGVELVRVVYARL